jgi:hypothetical protein
MKPTHISLNEIIIDDEIIARVELNEKYLAEIENDLKDGAKLPPVIVFSDKTDYYLVDGLHRYHAVKNQKQETIIAMIHKGDKRAAILFSCSVNSENGLRRTNDDKRKAVNKMLTDSEWSQWSDGVIAKHAGVTQPFVSRMRRDLTQNGFESTTRRVTANGRIIDTKGIGKEKATVFTEKHEADCDGNKVVNEHAGLTTTKLNVTDLIRNGENGISPESLDRQFEKDGYEGLDNEKKDRKNNGENDDPNADAIAKDKIDKFSEQVSLLSSKLTTFVEILKKENGESKSQSTKLKKLKKEVMKQWIELSIHMDDVIK